MNQRIKRVRPTLTEKPPTLSYSQLKVDVRALQVENAELKQKFTRHHNATFASKTAVKELQKENKELKKRLEDEENEHKESLTACQDELTTKTTLLETKLRKCDEALETSGINPVTLTALEHDEEQRKQVYAAATETAQVLREKLEENTNITISKVHDMEKISQQCQIMMKEAKGIQEEDKAPSS